jgi:hypothetical protein
MKISIIPAALAAIFLPLNAVPASAKLAPLNSDKHDIQCLGLIGSFADKAKKEEQAEIYSLAIFFMGRIMGRNPAFDSAAFSKANPEIGAGLDMEADTLSCMSEVETATKSFDKL